MKRTNPEETRNSWRTLEIFEREWGCKQEKCFREWIDFLNTWYKDGDTGSDDIAPAHCYKCHTIFIEGKNGAQCADCDEMYCEPCCSEPDIGNFDSDDEFRCAECEPDWCAKKKLEEKLQKDTVDMARVVSFEIATVGTNPFNGARIINIAASATDFCTKTLKNSDTRKFSYTETRAEENDDHSNNFDYNFGWWATDNKKKQTIQWLQTRNCNASVEKNLQEMIKKFCSFLKKEAIPNPKIFSGKIYVVTADATFTVPLINQLISRFKDPTQLLPMLKVKGETHWLEIIDLVSFKKGQHFKENKHANKFEVHPLYCRKRNNGEHTYSADYKENLTSIDFIENFLS